MANKLVCAGPCHSFLKNDTHEKIKFNGKLYCKKCWNEMVRRSLPIGRADFIPDINASLENTDLHPNSYGLVRDKFPIERGWNESDQ